MRRPERVPSSLLVVLLAGCATPPLPAPEVQPAAPTECASDWVRFARVLDVGPDRTTPNAAELEHVDEMAHRVIADTSPQGVRVICRPRLAVGESGLDTYHEDPGCRDLADRVGEHLAARGVPRERIETVSLSATVDPANDTLIRELEVWRLECVETP